MLERLRFCRRLLWSRHHSAGLQETEEPSLCFAGSHDYSRPSRCFGVRWITRDWQPRGDHGFEAVELKLAPAIGGLV
jgi:hypothetical protein